MRHWDGCVGTESEKMTLPIPTEVMMCWVSQTQSVLSRELEWDGEAGEDQTPTKEWREGLMGITSELSVKRKGFQ